MSDKKRIAEAFGYASFGEMILDRVEDMQILIENLPPICSKLRLDVASYARKRAAQRAAANAQRFSGTLTALPRSAARLAAHTRAFSAAQAPPSALHSALHLLLASLIPAAPRRSLQEALYTLLGFGPEGASSKLSHWQVTPATQARGEDQRSICVRPEGLHRSDRHHERICQGGCGRSQVRMVFPWVPCYLHHCIP